MDMVYCTIMFGIALGRIWRNRILASLAPRFFAACTNTFPLVAKVVLRTSLAKVGVLNTATAMTTFVMPLPRIAMMAIARIMPGNANSVSQILMMMESKSPP